MLRDCAIEHAGTEKYGCSAGQGCRSFSRADKSSSELLKPLTPVKFPSSHSSDFECCVIVQLSMLAQKNMDVVRGNDVDHSVGLTKAAQKNSKPVKLLTPLKFPSSQSCNPVCCLLMLGKRAVIKVVYQGW
jgi:hypothetical protein